MSHTERLIVELLRSEAKNYAGRQAKSILLRVSRMIEAGAHLERRTEGEVNAVAS